MKALLKMFNEYLTMFIRLALANLLEWAMTRMKEWIVADAIPQPDKPAKKARPVPNAA